MSEKTLQQIQEENDKLKLEIASYKQNGAVGLYYELNRLVNDTISFTRKNSIETLISSDEKGDKKFERAMSLVKAAKEHVLDMEEIKTKLKLSGNEDKDKDKIPFIETVAESRK